MKNPELTIVKLGGAAITDKSRQKTIRSEIIQLAISELKHCKTKLVIVHGAGSFGHVFADQFSLADGVSDKIQLSQQIFGLAQTKTALQELNLVIHQTALENGFYPFVLPVSASVITHGPEKVTKIFLDPLDHALKLGLTPILHGDICFDTSSKFRVISGDRIIDMLCQFFQSKSTHVIFGTDVDGIYDMDPHVGDATLLSKLSRTDLTDMIDIMGPSSGVDVTGGMKGKLKQIRKISNKAERVDVVNITVPNRLSSLLKTGETIGTSIRD